MGEDEDKMDEDDKEIRQNDTLGSDFSDSYEDESEEDGAVKSESEPSGSKEQSESDSDQFEDEEDVKPEIKKVKKEPQTAGDKSPSESPEKKKKGKNYDYATK